MSIIDQISQLEHSISTVKKSFEMFITNRDIPLEARWIVFVDAPDYLKNTEYSMCFEWCEYFGKDYVGYDCEYNVERHSFVNAAEVITNAEDSRDIYEGTCWAFFDIDEAKEKILAANLLGSTYGW